MKQYVECLVSSGTGLWIANLMIDQKYSLLWFAVWLIVTVLCLIALEKTK